jgi:pimeloyl-ACP methyl ester carboxylesterase
MIDNLPMSPLHPVLHHITCPAQTALSVPEHRMAVWQWGAEPRAGGHVVVCVHGLTRQGRDFDVLARRLLAVDPDLTVLCPDVVGRGQSDWLANPQGYQIPVYAADLMQGLSAWHARWPMARLDWVGTSMGGVVGLILAAQPAPARGFPFSRLVLNDVGPSLPWAFVERLRTTVGQPLVFPSVAAGARALREISSGFGPHTEEDWLALNTPMFKTTPQGELVLHYDPAIAEPIRQLTPEAFTQGETVLWSLYDHIGCPTLLVRGRDSEVLMPATAQAMTERGPRAHLLEFAGVGHAPTFVDPAQAQPLLDWLLA